MRLTENFNLSEFQRAGHEVPAEHLANVKQLAEQLQKIRDRIAKPIKIHSGYRTPAINTGVKRSQHLIGRAADLKVAYMTPRELYDLILSMIRAGDILQGGVGLYERSGFVHYDTRGRAARWRQR